MNLQDRYNELSPPERLALAAKCGINPDYLWQIANHWDGRRPSLETMAKLAASDPELSVADMVAEFTKPAKAA